MFDNLYLCLLFHPKYDAFHPKQYHLHELLFYLIVISALDLVSPTLKLEKE